MTEPPVPRAADRPGRRARPARFRVVLCAAAALTLAPRVVAPAQASPPKEYQLKAVFLYHFAQFVEWPAALFPEAGAPLVIGVLGEDPFGAYLDETVGGETVSNHPLEVRRYRHVDEIGVCHILFVSRSEAGRLEQILPRLKGRHTLTVSDAERFTGRGGMIWFVTDRNRIRLRINLAAAEAEQLKISSKLLRPAEIVSSRRE
jgi:hypothetical protein